VNDDLEPRPVFLTPTAAATSGASAAVSIPVFLEAVAEVTSRADATVSVGQVLRVIAQDRELFRRAADLALQTKDGTLQAEEAASHLAQDNPEVASLLARVPARARAFFITVLIAAITILATEALSELRDQSATPADVERIVSQHDRDVDNAIEATEESDMQRELRVAVDRALQEYYSQHPSTKDGR
jgi:hypothetical protein